MAGRLISGKKIESNNQAETWPQTIGRNIGSTGLKAIDNLARLGLLPPVILGKAYEAVSGNKSPFDNLPYPIETLTESGFIDPQFTETRGLLEHGLQTLGSQLPISLASGASLGRSAVANTLGALSNTAAKGIGFGPTGQAVAQIATEIPFGIKTIGSHKKELYESLPGLITKETESPVAFAPYFKKTSEKIADIGKHIANPKTREEVYNAAKIIEENFVNGKGNPLSALDARKAINAYKPDVSLKAKHYLNSMTESLNGFIEKISEPKFYKALSDADKLHAWQNNGSFITDYASRLKTVGKALQIPQVKRIADIATLVVDLPIKYGVAVVNPTVMKYALKSGSAAALDNPKLFALNMKALDRAINKNPEINTNEEESNPNGRLISGKKKV